ncbi:MAG: PrsW family intramembrane metalloprotease [Flavobacteriales bacterium]
MLLNKSQLFLVKYILPFSVLVIFLGNVLLPGKSNSFENLHAKGKRQEDPFILCNAYDIKLQENRISIDEALDFMNAYHELSTNEKTVFDASLHKHHLTSTSHFEELSRSAFSSKKDKGNLVLAYRNVVEKNSPKPFLDKVENHETTYWNYINARYLLQKHDPSAVIFLEEEFRLHPHNRENNSLLTYKWYQAGENEKLQKFLETQEEKDIYFFESDFYYKTGQWAKVFSTDYFHVFHPRSLIPAIASIIITLVWMFYLSFISVFKPARWSVILLLFLSGALFSFCTPLLTNFINLSVGFELNGHPGNDFLYCVVGIGLVEEIVKIFPVVVALLILIKKCEPVDVLIYASASALGFAFIENIIYFSDSLEAVSGRAFTSTILHMFMSSTLVYLFIHQRYRKNKKGWIMLLPGLLIAAAVHGFYDFWLINETMNLFFFLSLMLMVISIFVWTIMINNCLNISPLFNKEISFDITKANILLLSGLCSVFLLEFILTALNEGAEYANEALKYSMLAGGYLVVLLSTNLSKIDLVKDAWEKINLLPFRKILNINNIRNMSVVLTPGPQPLLSKASYPARATVTKKLVLNGEKNWFLLQFKWPVQLNNESVHHALVKIIHPEKSFSDENISVKIIYIKNIGVLEQEKISSEQLRYSEIVRSNEWIED